MLVAGLGIEPGLLRGGYESILRDTLISTYPCTENTKLNAWYFHW